MDKKITELVNRLESEISNTPSGELRNLLCDANITIQALKIQRVSICTCGTEEYAEKEPRKDGMIYCGKCGFKY